MKVLNFLPMAVLACSTAPIEAPKEKARDESYLATPCRVDSTREDFHEKLKVCNANIQTHQRQAIERVAAMQCGKSETLFKTSKTAVYQIPGFKEELAKVTDLSYISEAEKQRLITTKAFSHEIKLDDFARGLHAEDRR